MIQWVLVGAIGFGMMVVRGGVAQGMGSRVRLVPDYFAICTATLDGRNFTEILRDSKRQLSHIRVSNDHRWMTFTRFNKMDSNGIAVAEDGYEQTEIMLARTDGSKMEAIVPPRKGVANANSYWTPDNKGIIFTSTREKNIGQIYKIDLATRKITRVPMPQGLEAADPHMVGNLLVYTGKEKGKTFAIRIMHIDGTQDRPLTPARGDHGKGEFDPKLSPDGTRVAFMRIMKGNPRGRVHIIVADLKTGDEKDLSGSGEKGRDGLPEWSSDGKLLIYWHLAARDFRKSGLYTIHPDGSGRRKIPLPRGYVYSSASFFPGTGSGKDAKIIFSVRRLPFELRRKLENFHR